MNLNYDVFSVDPKPIPSQIPGFEQAVGQATWPPSTSTLIWSDDGGALLVDCLITTTEAAALATWIRSHGRELEYVYITHPHADHLLGLPAVLDAYPNAKPVALAESISAMETQVSPAYLNVWSAYFPGQLPDRPVVPTPHFPARASPSVTKLQLWSRSELQTQICPPCFTSRPSAWSCPATWFTTRPTCG